MPFVSVPSIGELDEKLRLAAFREGSMLISCRELGRNGAQLLLELASNTFVRTVVLRK